MCSTASSLGQFVASCFGQSQPGEGTSFYDIEGGGLYILGKSGNDTDEFDDYVIAHEWGNFLEYSKSRADSIGASMQFLTTLNGGVQRFSEQR